jgi:hypothetical protein
MRHEPISELKKHSEVTPAVWPNGVQLVHFPLSIVEEAERPAEAQAFLPAPSAPDVPAAVYGMIFSSYAALIGAFALATVRSAESIFVITISALFVIAFFTVPRIFFRVEPKTQVRQSLHGFMRDGLQTLTGHTSAKDALIQMMIVPVFLTIAALAMGVAAAVVM